MARKQLHVVTDDESVEPKPATILAAAELSERALLVALREKLAKDLDKGDVPAHAIKGVVAELRDVDRSIRALDRAAAEDEDSVVVRSGRRGWDQSAI